MISRFRMIAGPNGSGKTTLTEWLQRDYAVNFYHRLNADDIFVEVKRSRATRAPLPVENEKLIAYARASAYAPEIVARYARSLANVRRAIPFLSRAFFFDNGGSEMRYLASWSPEEGLTLHCAADTLPKWFQNIKE